MRSFFFLILHQFFLFSIHNASFEILIDEMSARPVMPGRSGSGRPCALLALGGLVLLVASVSRAEQRSGVAIARRSLRAITPQVSAGFTSAQSRLQPVVSLDLSPWHYTGAKEGFLEHPKWLFAWPGVWSSCCTCCGILNRNFSG